MKILAITNLTNILTSNFHKSTHIVFHTDNNYTLPRAILLEINFKKHLRSLWQRFRDPLVKTALNQQITRVKDFMLNYRNSQWNNLLGSFSDADEGIRRFYKLNKSLLCKPQPDCPLRDSKLNIKLNFPWIQWNPNLSHSTHR